MKYKITVEIENNEKDYRQFDSVYEQILDADNSIVGTVVKAVYDWKPSQLVNIKAPEAGSGIYHRANTAVHERKHKGI